MECSLAEIEEVMNREKIVKTYNISLSKRELLIKELRNSAEIVTPLKRDALPLNSRDKKDDMLLIIQCSKPRPSGVVRDKRLCLTKVLGPKHWIIV